MKAKLTKRNVLFLIIIAVLIIPQTRQPLQILLHKGLSYINQSTLLEDDDRISVNYENWRLRSDKASTYPFSEAKGKVVFVNFWATWCPPCIAEMPSLQLLYDDYKDKVEFLFVTNDDFEIVEKFKTDKGFSFEVYSPMNGIPTNLETRSIPRTFIINKKGDIVVDESGAINWNSDTVRHQLNQLLSE